MNVHHLTPNNFTIGEIEVANRQLLVSNQLRGQYQVKFGPPLGNGYGMGIVAYAYQFIRKYTVPQSLTYYCNGYGELAVACRACRLPSSISGDG